jgi:hypothetical protein
MKQSDSRVVGCDSIGRTRLDYPQGERIINIIGCWIKANEDTSLGKPIQINTKIMVENIPHLFRRTSAKEVVGGVEDIPGESTHREMWDTGWSGGS